MTSRAGLSIADPLARFVEEEVLPPLAPEDNIVEIMARFDAVQADELAVVDHDGVVLGTLSEKFVRKRYAEELEKSQRELFGE